MLKSLVAVNWCLSKKPLLQTLLLSENGTLTEQFLVMLMTQKDRLDSLDIMISIQ
jgi:hypothetical protein